MVNWEKYPGESKNFKFPTALSDFLGYLITNTSRRLSFVYEIWRCPSLSSVRARQVGPPEPVRQISEARNG